MEEKEQEEHHNEAEPPEQAGDEIRIFAGTTAGAGRYYECVFCKRGFSTAQALGGHMNIHRRDRTKIRPARSAPPGTRRAEDQAYHPYSREQSRTQPQVVLESSSSNYVVYLPGSSSTSGSGDKKEVVLAGEKQDIRKDQSSLEDLDLELRLGHSKRHETS